MLGRNSKLGKQKKMTSTRKNKNVEASKELKTCDSRNCDSKNCGSRDCSNKTGACTRNCTTRNCK